MKIFKRITFSIITAVVCLLSAVIFTGCDKDDDICKLYVFASVGGSVQVDNNEDLVKFGDEGSKCFTYKEDQKVKLKAIPDRGYQFVKWLNIEDEDEGQKFTNAEIELKLDEDEVVIKAIFEADGSIDYNINYPTSVEGYTIAPEDGYSSVVGLGGNFKFKVNINQNYSSANMIVKADGTPITPNSDGVYTISNINKDITITVEGVVSNHTPSVKTYTITTQNSKVEIQPQNTNACIVNAGESFEFKLKLTSGWKLGANAVIKAKGQTSTITLTESNNGTYVIYQIEEDIEITVDGIEEIITHTISKDGEGFSLDANSFVAEHGTKYQFKIRVENSYKVDGNMIVLANNVILDDVSLDGEYTIIVNENVIITVQGIVKKAVYKITSTNQYFDIIPYNAVNNTVYENEDFSFKLSLKAGIPIGRDYEVKVGEEVLTPIDGVYTIKKVNKDKIIVVERVINYITYTLDLYFADSSIVELSPGITTTIPYSITFTIEEDKNIAQGEAAENFEFNVSENQTTTAKEMIDNIEEYLETTIGLNLKVSSFDAEAESFIYYSDGELTINWSVLNSQNANLYIVLV